jgi:hypothetical protein
MGFSLSRALRAGIAGAAHEAGEVFDSMIVEERKQKEAEANMIRQKDLATYQADLVVDRERRRDEDKEKLSERVAEKLKGEMNGYYTAAREAGFDPNKIDGMRFIAAKALEDGKAGIYDKITDNIDKREKNLADIENRKIQLAHLGEARAARKREGMDAEDKAAMAGIFRQADRLVVPGARDENGKTITDADKDGAQAAVAWAESEREKGRSWKSIRSDLSQITDGFARQPEEVKKLPAVKRFDDALGYWNLTPEQRAEMGKKREAAGTGTASAPNKVKTTGLFGGNGILNGGNSGATFSAGDLQQEW